jgi:outer membrane protein assembly factor BamB
VHGDTVYAVAAQRNAAEMTLLAIRLDDGQLLWQVPLGTATTRQNVRGMMTAPMPVLRLGGGTLFVHTSNGCVLAVNTAARRVEWAFTFEIPAAPSREVFYAYEPREKPALPASLLVVGSMLYVKDHNHDQLHALDLTGPSLKWKRPIDAGAAVVHADERAIYTLGEELCRIDLATRDMTWSTKTPIDTGETKPAVVHGSGGGGGGDAPRVQLLGGRGVYDIDLRDGARTILRGYDREATGGAVWRVGDRLICVSNRAVTAYPLVAGNGR